MFGPFCTEKDIENMMLEADINGDKMITFSEFKGLMIGFKTTNPKLKSFWSINC